MGLPKNCEITLNNQFKKGPKNLITDVKGVKVGHTTIDDEKTGAHTGVTAILPHEGNLFQNKVMAGCAVLNGFGKSAGLVQVDELGTIEAPIMMTNTFGVGTVLNATIKYMLDENPDIGDKTGTVNCVVTECNDWKLNDIRGMHVKEEDALNAIKAADYDFLEGGYGAGTGMKCMDLKGGIGSSSRIVNIDGKDYTVGAIVLSNFGRMGELRIEGKLFDKEFFENKEKEMGSIVMVLATDIPLSDRQLKRLSKRAACGLGRVGSYMANGSGDIAIAFSTGNILPHYSEKKIIDTKMLFDDDIDPVFNAAVEAVEESVISCLYHAETKVGRNGNTLHGLREYLG